MTQRYLLLLVGALTAFGQNPQSFDARLGVSTIVREDLFAGFLTNDMDRLAIGVKNLDLLQNQRPQAKPEILAWQGGVELFHAARAHEQKQPVAFEQHYKRAAELFKQAETEGPLSDAVAAITGGSHILFGDRLPEQARLEAAKTSYTAYKKLFDHQEAAFAKMPVHHKGEVLAGLAQSAQRSGRTEEVAQYLDRIITLLPNTPYEARAKKWKESADIAGRTTIACMTCHDAGKLESRRAALPAQP